ncbi:putative integrase, partial [Escherichia coli O26:H11 str. CVM10026]
MPLTARQVETAKPKDKIYKIADGGGLYLQVNPNGSKYWRMKYHYAGKEKKLSFG